MCVWGFFLLVGRSREKKERGFIPNPVFFFERKHGGGGGGGIPSQGLVSQVFRLL